MSADDQWKLAYHALLGEQSSLNEEGKRMAAFVARYGREYIDATDVLSERVAALESVLRALIDHDNTRAYDTDKNCTFCLNDQYPYGLNDHTADCPVARARALLEASE